MFSTFAVALPRTLKYEGGYSADRRDPGNRTGRKIGKGKLKGTKYGVSAAAFPNLDIEHLTIADVRPIYRQRYWNKIEGDRLPVGPDFVTFDGAVHSGPSRSAKWLQRAIGGIPVDGDIGPITINAAKAIADKAKLVKDQCRKRTSFLQGLTMWSRYGKGFARRVADVEAFGVKLAIQASTLITVAPSVVADQAKAESKAADKAAKRAATAAKGTGTAGGTGSVGTTQIDAAHDPIVLWLVIGGVVVALVVTAVFVWRAHIQRQRAAAYQDLEHEQRAAPARERS